MKLYACPGTCSLAPHILLHEFGLEHEVVWLDLTKGDSHTPEFLELNPVGQVPTLVTREGEVITEVAAISLYLFEKHGHSDTPLHQTVRQLSFIASELHKSFFALFFGKRIVGEEAAPRLADFYKAKLKRHWQYIDELLPQQDDLDSKEMGPADPYLYTVCRWWKSVGESFQAYPSIEAFLGHMEARSSVRSALEHEGLKTVAVQACPTRGEG
jgi:glutathione S-transferase